jgi:D-alanyl-D-alanine carboxypeptidase
MQPMPDVVVASVAPVPAPMPADLGLQPAVQAANQLASPSAVQPAERPVDVIGAWISETFSLGAPPAPLGQTPPSEPLVPPVGVGQGGQPIDLMTSGAIGNKPANDNDAKKAGGWVVQIGALPDETGANKLLDDASSKVADLADFRPYIERFDKNGQTFYRARYVGFGDHDTASRICDAVKKADMSCLALQSRGG